MQIYLCALHLCEQFDNISYWALCLLIIGLINYMVAQEIIGEIKVDDIYMTTNKTLQS